jgi:DNA-binding transcriptional ArsR family regulator
MLSTSAFAEIGALVGDPARANMLAALMDGRALTASELARVAGVAPQTASGHLSRLTEARLLGVERQGRHRYYRLASSAVAGMLEGIMSVAAGRDELGADRGRVRVGPRDQALRRARTCYDHLAGQVAVAIADSMVERGHIQFTPEGGAVTETGAAFLSGVGLDLGDAGPHTSGRGRTRIFCRPCLDWSERRPHIAGLVGAALCRTCLAKGWLRRVDGTRALTVTPAGKRGLASAFGVRVEA